MFLMQLLTVGIDTTISLGQQGRHEDAFTANLIDASADEIVSTQSQQLTSLMPSPKEEVDKKFQLPAPTKPANKACKRKINIAQVLFLVLLKTC